MKKLVTLMLALAMIISAVGVLAEADGKITIWTWDPTFNIKAMQIAKEMYLKDHPDAVIDIQEKLSADIETAVIAANGDTSTLPDILLHQDNSFQKFVTNYPEVYADLTGKYDYEGFAEGKLAYSIVDGKNRGIPFDAGTAVAAYRTDYLEAAGYTAADLKDITWERFIEIGRDVKAKTGRPMLSGCAGAVDTVLIMLQSCGASMFSEDGSVNLKNNEPLKEVIDFYATQTTLAPDGRRIMTAWLQTWSDTEDKPQGCKWFGQTICPRELHIKDGRILQTPVRELDAVHGKRTFHENVTVQGETSLDGIKGRVADLTVQLEPGEEMYHTFTVKVAAGEDYYTSLTYDSYSSVLTLDRSHAGSRADIVHTRSCKVRRQNGALKLRILLDKNSVEVFVNDGEQTMTAWIYTPQSADGITFAADGKATITAEQFELNL